MHGATLPIATKIDAIDDNDAFAIPTAIDKRISYLCQREGRLIKGGVCRHLCWKISQPFD